MFVDVEVAPETRKMLQSLDARMGETASPTPQIHNIVDVVSFMPRLIDGQRA